MLSGTANFVALTNTSAEGNISLGGNMQVIAARMYNILGSVNMQIVCTAQQLAILRDAIGNYSGSMSSMIFGVKMEAEDILEFSDMGNGLFTVTLG